MKCIFYTLVQEFGCVKSTGYKGEGNKMKKIGIIGAMPVEIELIKNEFKNCCVETNAGVNYYLGRIKDIEVILLSCGVGKVNAAIYTQILIDKYSVDAIINTGVAGGLSNDIRHLSVVISSQLIYYDVHKIQMINCFPNQEFFKADTNLIKLAAEVSESDNSDYNIGTIVSGEDFITDTERKRELRQIYKATCVEMEGAAIAHTAFVNKVPFLVIRCISDLANEAASEDYKKFEKLAAHKSAALVKDIIYHLNENNYQRLKIEDIINKVKQFQYTSLEYAEPDDLSDSKICIDNDKSIFLYSKTDKKAKIDWAANSKENFFNGLKETINQITHDKTIRKVEIEFIPEDYVPEMENHGFIIISEWVDFWNNDLAATCFEQSNTIMIRKIKENEYQIASEVTKSCNGYSRGFKGEPAEWIKEWNESENSCIFIAELNNEIVGICFINLYGFEDEKGIVLWLREVAVNPKYHSQKIGFNLMTHAINWGKRNGAVRSFLACDAENIKGIKLYEGLGYQRKAKRGQINMGKNI